MAHVKQTVSAPVCAKKFVDSIQTIRRFTDEEARDIFSHWDESLVPTMVTYCRNMYLLIYFLTTESFRPSVALYLSSCEANDYRFPGEIWTGWLRKCLSSRNRPMPFWLYETVLLSTQLSPEYAIMPQQHIVYHILDDWVKDEHAATSIEQLYNNASANLRSDCPGRDVGIVGDSSDYSSLSPDTPSYALPCLNVTLYLLETQTTTYPRHLLLVQHAVQVRQTAYRAAHAIPWYVHNADWSGQWRVCPDWSGPRRVCVKDIKRHRARLLLQTLMLGLVAQRLPVYIYLEIASFLPGVDPVWFRPSDQVSMIMNFVRAHQIVNVRR